MWEALKDLMLLVKCNDLQPQICGAPCVAYGTPFAKDIDSLRAFRDGTMLKSDAGSKIIDWYYREAPAVAEKIAGKPWLKSIVRTALTPVVQFTQWWNKE